jgi:DNA modification methylase
VLEGFRFIGIEQDAEYAAIAERRIAHWMPRTLQPALPLEGAAD